ncbi:hypothetical protein HMPREF3100_18915 [Enterococcus sp. HMSC29A04]|nr:hypothetical protein HMPREF3001_03545 [Enterococcus sp. HMSC066C04]OFT83097.1 hypothetical protein HMPREF3100_18915 [Enterococcus sp. HMSC29A04]OFU64175.1 hypothetical protein HMPREF3128_09905 [Enterococcus sp. HMSC14A10]
MAEGVAASLAQGAFQKLCLQKRPLENLTTDKKETILIKSSSIIIPGLSFAIQRLCQASIDGNSQKPSAVSRNCEIFRKRWNPLIGVNSRFNQRSKTWTSRNGTSF